MIPVASQFVFPLLCTVVEFHDQSHLRRLLSFKVRGRPGVAAGTGGAIVDDTWLMRIEAVADHRLKQCRCLVAGLEPRYINRPFIRAHSQCPWSVREEGHDPDGLSTKRCPQIRR